eukprot:scpid88887/ scgid5540/ 
MTFPVKVRVDGERVVPVLLNNKGRKVKQVKKNLKKHSKIETDGSVLLYGDTVLQDNDRLSDRGVPKGATLQLILCNDSPAAGRTLHSVAQSTDCEGTADVLTEPFVQLDTKTLHVSCRSDRLQLTGSCNAVGMVLWSYNELKEWSVSGVRCKSGYVYVKRLSAITLEEHQDERDQVHGRLYASLFRGDFGSVVTATGFDLYQGAWTWFSGRLDISSGKWVDRREASQLEQDLILLSYRTWINGGPQNNAIADLRDRIRY